MQAPFSPSPISSLLVNQKQKIRIPTSNIIMLEGYANYTLFHLQDGRKKLYSRTLKYYEDLLSEERFIRVHRGFLVNTSFIVSYNKEENILHLENNFEVSISRRKRRCLEGIIEPFSRKIKNQLFFKY